MAPVPSEPVPQHCPTHRELDDLELLTTGALAPTTRFNEPGSPVTLTLPDELADAPVVELVDPEGLPLARVTTATGEVEPLTHHQFGAFRRLYLTPKQVREQYAGATFVPVVDALTEEQLSELAGLGGPVVLLALVGTGTPALSPTALLRASLAAAARLEGHVVAVPLAAHGDPQADHDLGVRVVRNYAGPDPVHALRDDTSPWTEVSTGSTAVDSGQPAPPEVSTGSTAVNSGQPAPPEVSTGTTAVNSGQPTSPEVSTGSTAVGPEPTYPPEIAAIVEADQPPPDKQGLVLFFTGLSGSGKSTLARALVDKILEQTDRPVTSLDGDVVRRHLSAGLTFSKADRETNIRRIGWVAAEIARHGGIAVCSPIAPFAETRAQVRQMVEDAGGAFFLVHVATPLEECERRDRKGLYAKARRGEIPEFTGISSPYEEPDDAAVRVDTTGRTIEDTLVDVVEALREAGYLDLDAPDPTGGDSSTNPGPQTVQDPPATRTSGGSSTVSATQTVEQTPPRSESDGDDPLDVLFVCTANICRSAHMELTARRLAGPSRSVRFSSAGTHGLDANPMDPDMAAHLEEGESEGFTSRPLTPQLVEQADLVLTAEAAHRARILEEHPEALRKVFTLGWFAEAVEQAEDHLRGRKLVEAIGARRSASRPEHDIEDPYRRGDEAIRAATGTISTMLSVIVPRLVEDA